MFDSCSIFDNDCCTCCFLVGSIDDFVVLEKKNEKKKMFDIMMNRIAFEIWNDDKKKTCKNDDNVGGIILHFQFVYLFQEERKREKLVLVDF